MDLWTAIKWCRDMCDPSNSNHVSATEREALETLIACGETVSMQALTKATREDHDEAGTQDST